MLVNSSDVASEWQKLDAAFEHKSNENFYFLGSLYQLLASILDLAMRWQHMIKQEERSEEWKVRNEFFKLSNISNSYSNTSYNIEKKLLEQKLDDILDRKEKRRIAMYKAKYKAVSDDASGTFYKAHAQKVRNKRRIEKCEIQNANGENIMITNPVDIAGHFTKTYETLFNTKHKSSKKMLDDFMGRDIDKLGKITNIERNNLAADISYEEMQDCIEEMTLSAQGGPTHKI